MQFRQVIQSSEQKSRCSHYYIRVKHLLFKSSKKVSLTAFCHWQWPMSASTVLVHVWPQHAQRRIGRAGHQTHTHRFPEITTSQVVIRALNPEAHWFFPHFCEMKLVDVSPPFSLRKKILNINLKLVILFSTSRSTEVKETERCISPISKQQTPKLTVLFKI